MRLTKKLLTAKTILTLSVLATLFGTTLFWIYWRETETRRTFRKVQHGMTADDVYRILGPSLDYFVCVYEDGTCEEWGDTHGGFEGWEIRGEAIRVHFDNDGRVKGAMINTIARDHHPLFDRVRQLIGL